MYFHWNFNFPNEVQPSWAHGFYRALSPGGNTYFSTLLLQWLESNYWKALGFAKCNFFIMNLLTCHMQTNKKMLGKALMTLKKPILDSSLCWRTTVLKGSRSRTQWNGTTDWFYKTPHSLSRQRFLLSWSILFCSGLLLCVKMSFALLLGIYERSYLS